MKILLVEDSATLRHVMCTYISAAGHEPEVAESGEGALQILDTTPVDMVIMDVEMPGLDGFETTRLIREWLGDHWIPIIFVTGKSEDSSLEEGIAAGGDDYLIKPINQVILNAKIKAMERITAMRNQMSKLNEELTILSQRDGLTQLYNRRTFEDKAQEIWRLSTRNKQPISILLLDIDHFKLFNDCYGHPAGDECIKKVAYALEKCLNRPGDLVGRYGGEEFIAMLPNTPEHGAMHIAEHIRRTIEGLNIRHRTSLTGDAVTVSIGASIVNYTTGTNLAYQIEQADKALYESKDNGRNTVTTHEFNPRSKVLLVDDCEDTLELIADNLRGHCTVISTTSGEECITLAQEFRPDLVLVDVYMNGIDGPEVCERLKNSPITSYIPIILISSCQKDELHRYKKEVNANGFLQKPLNSDKLIAKVNQFLS